MKSYTDIEQSKKLAKILLLESADMYWFRNNVEVPCVYPKDMMKDSVSVTCPCWSLTALLKVLPNYIDYDTIRCPDLIRNIDKNYMVIYSPLKHSGIYDNPVDACVDMIEKLNEQNLL